MNKEKEKINKEIQNFVFDELKNDYEYWGENNLIEMTDFCRLKSFKSMLGELSKPL
jgi:hypothetical protein